MFHEFYSPELTDADFASKPMVLLIGQYSTGKSTFIRHLLGRDYPGLRIGPEPTTDKFVVVHHGPSDQVIPGNALVVDRSMPFTQLSHFGNSFLSRLECARLDSSVLEGVTFVDSPGVLSGEKQRLQRGYDMEAIVKWFADRVDIILLLFDVSKLDISDEFRRILSGIKGNDTKIHIVLNKADRVSTPALMRVYGALMWSLGKVIDTPEVSRVYIGSFWDEPLENEEQRRLFESEETDLYKQLAQLPRSAAVNKINDLIKRVRLAKVHAYIMDHLKRNMPSMFGKGKAQRKMLADLQGIFEAIAKEHHLPIGDFPNAEMMAEKLATMEFKNFKRIEPKRMAALERMLTVDLPALLQMVPSEREGIDAAQVAHVSSAPEPSPFSVSAGRTEWLVRPDVELYRAAFEDLAPMAGKLSGQMVKAKMMESKLPANILNKVWVLADADNDGLLTLGEFALAMHFIKMRLDGYDLPTVLPPDMRPIEDMPAAAPAGAPFFEEDGAAAEPAAA